MAAFKQDFTITQSTDCSTLTIADNSNFSSNTEGYTFSTFDTKNITIYDAASNVLATLNIVNSNPVTFTVTKDLYLTFIYLLQIGSSTPLTKTYSRALSCFIDLDYGRLVANEYNSNPTTNSSNSELDKDQSLFNIIKSTKAAQVFASTGNGALSQSMLDYANSFVNTFITTP